jgi:glycosyltransferase involved in cell wall biosynthesis
MKPLPISLTMFVKNEERNLRDAIESVKPIVKEIVIIDTGSQDNTIEVAKKYTDRIYQIPFIDFGTIRTLAAHLASQPWVLQLDADERILSDDWYLFAELIDQPTPTEKSRYELDSEDEKTANIVIDSWALPRKRYSDKYMRNQIELEAYPDWQVRLFKNHPNRRIGFKRRIHEKIYGCVRTEQSPRGPTVHHLQGVGKPGGHNEVRKELYTKLYNMDIAEGIVHTEPPIADIDK